jgi:hypothetical protein
MAANTEGLPTRDVLESSLRGVAQAAAQREREACALLATQHPNVSGHALAALIRARSGEPALPSAGRPTCTLCDEPTTGEFGIGVAGQARALCGSCGDGAGLRVGSEEWEVERAEIRRCIEDRDREPR